MPQGPPVLRITPLPTSAKLVRLSSGDHQRPVIVDPAAPKYTEVVRVTLATPSHRTVFIVLDDTLLGHRRPDDWREGVRRITWEMDADKE